MIVSHDDNRHTLAQLAAHRATDPDAFAQFDWLVIHNGVGPSPRLDGPLEGVRLCVTRNHGYGAAVNRALLDTRSEFLLVLNADLCPRDHFLSGVLQCAWDLEDPAAAKVAIVGFALRDPDGSLQGSCGRFPTLASVLAGLLRPRATRKYIDVPQDRPTDVPWLTGASLFLRRSAIEKLGGFDERFFMYYEDVDLCQRAWQAGYVVRHEPGLQLVHYHPYHGRPLTHRLVFLARHGLLTYFRKHRPAWEARALLHVMRLECSIRQRHGSPEDVAGWRQVAALLERFAADPDCRVDVENLPVEFQHESDETVA